jgi:SET domain-containing protein 6
MGSRILSRSFQVKAPPAVTGTDSDQTLTQEDSEMSIDELSPNSLNNNDLDETIDDDDSDDDDPENVAMVPMADMLNARYGCENVRVHRP